MNIYKLLTATLNFDGDVEFKDLYIDVSKAIGMYIPEIPEEDNEPPQVRIYLEGGFSFDVVQEEHILQYLKENIADGAFDVEKFIKESFDKK